MQALLGIIYSGDWLAFIKEAFVLHSYTLKPTLTVLAV